MVVFQVSEGPAQVGPVCQERTLDLLLGCAEVM